jgi:hypothetical protein
MALLHAVVGAFLMAQIMATLLRPAESSLIFMSWTLPLMPGRLLWGASAPRRVIPIEFITSSHDVF